MFSKNWNNIFFSQNFNEFESIQKAIQKVKEKKIENNFFEKKTNENESNENFPFQIKKNENIFKSTVSEEFLSNRKNETIIPDKGFFVQGDIYKDEYIAATAAEIPEDEMNEQVFYFYFFL